MKLTLVNARNRYATPSVGLTFNSNQDTSHNKLQIKQFETTLELDTHHQHLLRSDIDEEVVLGIYSVTHWHLNRSPDLHQSVVDVLARIDPRKCASLLRSAITDLDHGCSENALLLLANRLFGGRMTLASAMLAFADTENAALFDDKSAALLQTMTANEISGTVNVEHLVRQAGETLNHACARYATYCKALQYIKYRFNRTCYGWSDGTGSQMTRFRAVDVARALEVLVEEGAELRVIA